LGLFIFCYYEDNEGVRINYFASLASYVSRWLGKSIHYQIYTDGAYKKGLGSWAFVAMVGTKVIKESSGKFQRSGSSRMEFHAAIEALRWLPPGARATIHSDSRMLVEGLTKKWPKWRESGWMKKDRPLFNADQLKIIDELLLSRVIHWKWVRAHSGIEANERCDQLCVLERMAR
jgi:ribonuclease HI